uniref:Integrase catalytic domain-containing protein n=1 Tax=Tanacetum cinerariifolium TaxID=118510 RepID=A0A6L2K2P5_TANCI|nr:hypothetical protein [Tanacetum cinerariifolium]
MDLCGLMRVESVNGKKYILVIVNDDSRFTWGKCLRLKDKALVFIIKFLKMIQVGISHETSVARSPQQNSVVERQAVATACYTQNRSIIQLRHEKTPYELLHNKLLDLSFLHANILLFKSRLRMHPSKLKSKWYGPNVVKTMYPYGSVDITDKKGISFKVNGQRLKKYYDGHIDTKDKEVVEFNKDTT